MQEGSNKIKKYILRAVKVILIVLIATTLVINIFKTDKTISAGEHTITVNKVSTVSVYLSGPGVILESSNKDKDVYKVDTGTNVTLHAVNESRIFTGWVINNGSTTDTSKTDPKTTITVSSDLTVSVTRRDATTDDYGKYMLDRFVISDQEELIALQDILAGSNANADFAHFYSAETDYDTQTEKDTLRENLRKGYFLISNNFVVFDSGFSGIGTNGKPFEGVMCGLNNGVVSSLFVTLSTTEVGGTQSYGLFKYLGPNAVIRNLKVVTTIGMKEATSNVTNGIQYIGGLTGYMNDSLLVSVTTEAKMGISVRNSVLHVGGIAGITTSGTGFESVGNVKYNGDGTSWTIQSASGSQINAGLIAGSATNTYVNSLNINVTDSVVDLKADGNSTLTLGNVFGNYTCTTTTTLQNINIVGSKGQILRTVAHQGESNVGGLIGKATASTNGNYLQIGKTDFNVIGSKSTYMSSTAGTSSNANLHTGGLIGQVTGSNCTALSTFKNRLSTIMVDESEVKVFDYLFEGDYEITSVQNGTATANTNSRSIAGGLVGKGIIDIDGGCDLAFASPSSSLIVNATQSKLSDTTGTLNDKNHACAALIYGSVENVKLTVNNVNIYSNNTTIETLREIGSKAMGDLHTGTITGYVENASALSNIGIYLNNSSIFARSLSYEADAKNEKTDTNSAFCGGLVGQATGGSTLTNITFAGYNPLNAEVVGTTSKMESIQNTVPGGGDYKGENYIGGIVGRIQYVTLTNCKYIGSEGSEDYIKMNGHESPDSAFCGGIVGMIRTSTNGVPSSIINCGISNAYVYAAATNKENYGNPDIYVGGILGAAYVHSATNSTVRISGCRTVNTDIYGLGNDYIAVYAGGTVGGVTWESPAVTIEDTYVVNSNVDANLLAASGISYNSNIESAAGGIIGMKGSTGVNINYSAVIDTNVNSYTNYTGNAYNTRLSSYAAGFGAFNESGEFTLRNCYSNAIVNSLAQLNSTTRQTSYDHVYPLAISVTIPNNLHSYYLEDNVPEYTGTDPTRQISLSSNPITVSNGTAVYANARDAHRYVTKLYVEEDSPYFSVTTGTNRATTVSCSNTTQYRSTLANIWVNVTENGDSTLPTAYATIEEANAAGWFIIDRVVLQNNVSSSTVSSSMTNIDSSYYSDKATYEYHYDSVNDEHYVQNVADAEDIIKKNYQEKLNGTVQEYTIRVYDDMLNLRINFDLTNLNADYQLVFKNGSTVLSHSETNSTFGNIEFKKLTNTNYELTFDPNELIEEEMTLTIEVHVGNTVNTANRSFKLILIPNTINLVGITYADYTPPLNYYITNGTLGSESEPFQLYVGSITKFVPVIKKSNDPDTTKTYVLEDYIERYTYTLTGNVGTIYSSGELKASGTANIKGTLTLKDKINGESATVHLKTVNQYTVTYNITGADTEGLTYATSSTDFYFEQILRSNYGGIPDSATIKIGTNTINLTASPVAKDVNGNPLIEVYEIYHDGTRSTSPITSWDADAHGYVFYVKGVNDGNGNISVNGNIVVNFTYPIVYTITFNLQCDTFNSSYTKVKKYKVHADVSYKDFFKKGTTGSPYEEIMTWAEGAAIFGYVFKGFYMVDFASTLPTYGISFDELVVSNNNVTASITLYARWSFLVELIEAPGTTIVSSFPSSFMEEHYEEDKFNREILIPINLNEGYVFTIEKDSTFKGEASVAAYSVHMDGDSHIITEIVLEKYHDNMYLYYVLPEYITGYLVIVTSVSNAEIIVGENTSSVAEEILPEDGVSTFKYIVNHKNVPANGAIPAETSYIFNSGKDIDGDGDYNDDKLYNLSVTKDFRLYFYKEVYSAGSVTRVPRTLAIGTEIKIYYTVYYNDDVNTTKNIVAVYRVTNNDTSYVSINDFTLMDLYTPAFTPETFGTFMGSNQVVSEIFYSVVTPPNGLADHVHNEVVNYVIEGGFYDANYTNHANHIDNSGCCDKFVSGIRSGNELANKDDLDFDDVQSLLIESSGESKVFAVTPSRVTNVTKSGDTYTFTDKLTFELCQAIFTQTDIHGDYVPLYDDTRQSTIETTEFKFDIKELRLSLGYGLGKVRIYGLKDGTWIPVEEIEVESAVYSEYIVSFMDDHYDGFKIDNISTNEIRINKLDIVSRSNGYVYSTTSNHLKELSSVDGVTTYSLLEYVVGDTRHDSKSFMLAIQFKDGSGNIVEDIRGSVYITAMGTKYYALIDQTGTTNYGKTTAFINLTAIADILLTESFDFTLTIPSGYTIHTIQLIESDNSNKPAMGEVRVEDIK